MNNNPETFHLIDCESCFILKTARSECESKNGKMRKMERLRMSQNGKTVAVLQIMKI